MTYAKDTKVPPDRSRAEIERTLTRFGADAFSYGYEGDRSIVAFRAQGRMVRFEVTIPSLSDFRVAPGRGYRVRTQTQQENARDQAIRQRWRALLLVIKAKLESIEAGIESFDEAFLPHLLLPDRTTVGDWLGPQIEAAYETGEMPELLPAARPQLRSGDGVIEGTMEP